ncbi:MAG TPA: tripartite tricarboxylate transporter substrate binding protein [Burkholderiaceae bacterium]|nr:tripartite tricarboxylate transporter substrate binding protein [Burkholderiaceae bacterium]
MQVNLPLQRRRHLFAFTAAVAASTLLPLVVHAQDKYPSRPIELIVPWGAGGGADQLARRVSKLLEPDLKTSIPVINVPGATGNTGMTKLMSAAPEGYSAAILIGDTLSTIAGGGRWKLTDVIPLGVMIRQPTGLYVKTDSKYKTFEDLLADARNNELKVAILGFGSADEILINQINAKGAKLRMVPFASPGERYSSILGGHADVLVEQAGDIRSFLDSKQMRPLVFFASAPAPGFASVPLAKDSGFPIVINQFRSIVVRAGTDPKQVATLSAALEKVARSPEFVKYLEDELAYADSFIPAAQAGAFLERELKSIEQNAPKKQ